MPSPNEFERLGLCAIFAGEDGFAGMCGQKITQVRIPRLPNLELISGGYPSAPRVARKGSRMSKGVKK
jgi:hypothetical protein